jgi:trehalose/maltose hydrolase-like predicted phosphorylase
MWQQIVHGFAGMVTALHTDTLTFRPCLPEEISSIIFKVYWKQDLVRVSVATDALEVENLSSNRIEFVVHDKQATVEAGARGRIAYQGPVLK